MKFKKDKKVLKGNKPPGFQTGILERKHRRLENRRLKRRNRAGFHFKQSNKNNQGSPNSKGNSSKIKQLQEYAETQKLKMGVYKNKAEGQGGAVSVRPGEAKGKAKGKALKKKSSDRDGEETQGFKMSSSTSARMARLQEYVNQEAGKMGVTADSNKPKKKKKKKKGASKAALSGGETNENLIKDKGKLEELKRAQEEDTKLIKELSKKLKNDERRMAHLSLGGGFGSLLDDIEQGNTQQIKKYKNFEDSDSEDDLDKDMAIALGQTDTKSKKEKKLKRKEDGKSRIEEDGEDFGEDMYGDDFDAFERGFEVSSEDDSTTGFDYNEEVEEEFGEEEDDFENEESLNVSEGEFSDDEEAPVVQKLNRSGHKAKIIFNQVKPKEVDLEKDSDDEVDDRDNVKQIDFGRISREWEEDFDGDDEGQDEFESEGEEGKYDYEGDEEVEEEEENSGFFDDEAMEGSEEESEDDGTERTHDAQDEHELAFEAGSSYTKPEILKNGMENDIDRYSSNSDDDEDLDDFVVDDDEVEFDEEAEDELPVDEFDDSYEEKNRKKSKKRLIIMSDSDEGGNENGDKSDDDDDDDDSVDNVDLNSKAKKVKVKLSSKSRRMIISDEDSEDSKNGKDSSEEESDNEHRSEKESDELHCSEEESDNEVQRGLKKKGDKKKKKKGIMSDDVDESQSDDNRIENDSDCVDDVNLQEKDSKIKVKMSSISRRMIISDEEDESDSSGNTSDAKEVGSIVRKKNLITDDGEEEKKMEINKDSPIKIDKENDFNGELVDNEQVNLQSKKKKKKGKDKVSLSTSSSDNSLEGGTTLQKKKIKKKRKIKENMDDTISEKETEISDETEKGKKRKRFTVAEESNENSPQPKAKKNKKMKVEELNSSQGSGEEDSTVETCEKTKTILKKPSKAKKNRSDIESTADSKRRVSFDLPDKSKGLTDSESDGDGEFSNDEDGAEFSNDEDGAEFSNDEDGAEFSNNEEDGAVFSGGEDGTGLNDGEDDAVFSSNKVPGVVNKPEEELTEDIYGRLRDRDGNVVEQDTRSENGTGKYIPPALRKLMALNTSEKKKEQLAMLKKTLKGLLNRLAEGNMASIANQIEGMYGKYSHNDMSDVLTTLLTESLVMPTLTPERLVQEHAMLVAVLSANVGEEVGAHIINEFVLKWNDAMEQPNDKDALESKVSENLLQIIANMYNFKIVDSTLIYGILDKLASYFGEKEVDLILLVLRNVGFTLRKDDPMALKSLIGKIQTQAADKEQKASGGSQYSRVQFMLEVIQAIRNNNMAKMPNYDPTHVEHLKKVLKGMVRKGNQVAPLKVTLEHLLNSRECGRWWIVGSAWSGGIQSAAHQPGLDTSSGKQVEYSEEFKKRAAKLQLSRPPRINILYIITEGSEDYLDAFEKLIQLKLPTQQESELFNVILLCVQKCKVYNAFFAHLSNKICQFNRRYKGLVKFALWDKFKDFDDLKEREVANLAKYLAFLIGEDALNLSVLKAISFMEVDSTTISFLRQVMIGLLLHPSGATTVERVFTQLNKMPTLKVLKASIRIFIAKFLTSKKNSENPNYKLLSSRIKMVSEILGKSGVVLM